MAELKKETEYKIATSFCQQCQCYRYFYCHKDGVNWFCQMCGWISQELEGNKNGVEKNKQ